eukprot:6292268-Pyramimonas_sp.AAC.1
MCPTRSQPVSESDPPPLMQDYWPPDYLQAPTPGPLEPPRPATTPDDQRRIAFRNQIAPAGGRQISKSPGLAMPKAQMQQRASRGSAIYLGG